MRVLMISKACVVGAYQKKLEELARLPDMELTVVVPPYWRERGRVLPLERLHTAGYTLEVEKLALNGNFHLHFYPHLGRQMQRVRPHLVHIDEEPYNLATFHALWRARRIGARSLFFSWQNINRSYPLPFRWMERYVLRHADYGIVGNRESEDVWRAKGYQGPLAVIPQFGVDTEQFAPGSRSSEQDLTIGYAGRLVEEKGVDLLLEALVGLEGKWKAMVVGSGPSLEALRIQARRPELEDRVSFIPQVPSKEMPAVYRRFDVLVLPSRTRANWKEQFGRVLVEGMACGVPVIGSDSGEIPHVIGDAGLIFREGRADLLRKRLDHLIQSPERRAELARRGRERVLANYTQAKVASRTYQVYKTMLMG
jgi:glycosyltransferase involved in cell wall biosynthesis